MKKSTRPISRNMTLFSALVWTAASALWIWNIGTRGGYGLNVLAMAASVVAAIVWWRRWWHDGKEKSDSGAERRRSGERTDLPDSGEAPMEDRRAKRPWVRWLMLAVAVLELWLVWAEIQDYQQIAAAEIFSPEAFAAWAAGERFQWLVYGTLAAIFLFNFATWKLHQNTRPLYIAEGIFFLLLNAAWGICAFFLPFHLLSGWKKVLLVLLLLALIGFGIYNLWNYHKLRKTTLDIV